MEKTINLIDIEKSDVKYENFLFPDGEPHIVLDPIDRKKSYEIIARITNPSELFLVMQVMDILKRQDVIFSLTLTYLMSMRMDRVISFNEAFSLKMVADCINRYEPHTVNIFECHSDRAFHLINNSQNLDLLHKYSGQKYSDFYIKYFDNPLMTICFPDNGAYQRYFMHGMNENPLIVMDKVRDLENKGKITSLTIKRERNVTKDILIVDDLCDGGGTFCWSAETLRNKYKDGIESLNIFVKHLVNPVGLTNLAKTFDNVYITDSYKDWNLYMKENELNYPNVHVLSIFN